MACHALPDMRVALAMRLRRTIDPARVLSAMNSDGGLRRLFVLPLYPQYSATTTATVFDAVSEVLRGWARIPELRFLADYHDDASWLEAAADSVRALGQRAGRAPAVQLSWPAAAICRYRRPVPWRSAWPVPRRLPRGSVWSGVTGRCPASRASAREPWLQPYTDLTSIAWRPMASSASTWFARALPSTVWRRWKRSPSRTPSVSTEKGGETLNYIPCLNAALAHVAALAALVRRQTADWQDPDGAAGTSALAKSTSTRREASTGLRWGKRGGQPLLALRLARQRRQLCSDGRGDAGLRRAGSPRRGGLDLAGHGYSAHRPDGAVSSPWTTV